MIQRIWEQISAWKGFDVLKFGQQGNNLEKVAACGPNPQRSQNKVSSLILAVPMKKLIKNVYFLTMKHCLTVMSSFRRNKYE